MQREDLEDYLVKNKDVLEHQLATYATEYARLQARKTRPDTLSLEGLAVSVPLVEQQVCHMLEVEIKERPEYLVYTPILSALNSAKTTMRCWGVGMSSVLLGMTASTVANVPVPAVTWWSGAASALLTGAGIGAVKYIFTHRKDSRISTYHNNTITLAHTRSSILGAYAHEFTHYLQNKQSRLLHKFHLSEGHARGVELAISRLTNEHSVRAAVKRVAHELQNAYLYLGLKGKLRVQDSLNYPHLYEYGKRRCEKSKYIMATSTMMVAEAKHGQTIYRDVLKGDFSFLV